MAVCVWRPSVSCVVSYPVKTVLTALPVNQCGAVAGSSIKPFQPLVCTCRAIAQMKPASSRATATTALVFITRRATRSLNFAFSRSCAFQAISVTALGSWSWRAAMIGLSLGLCW